MIDNIILYALGIFLMAGMSGWGRPVIIVLIALLYVSVSDLMLKEMLRYMEMGAFIVMAIAMPDHALMLFLPLLVYDCVRMRSWKAGVITGIGGLMQCVWLAQGEMELFRFLLWCFALILAAILSVRTKRSLRLAQEVIHLKDSSTELRLVMQKRQQDLLEKQDYEIHLATLQERNRIAREIHDNVGHLLSRCILIVGAMKIVNEDEKLSSSIEQLEESLNTAMTSVRESVHDLHDDSVNLREVTEELVGEFTFCPVDLSYDMGYDVPREIKYGFIAIVKEALHNIVRHSDASKVKIVMREHPALYQLIVEDNGTVKEPIQSGGVKAVSREYQSGQGMGLRNMSDRVRMLGGMMQIVRKEGFRIFITIPKEVS